MACVHGMEYVHTHVKIGMVVHVHVHVLACGNEDVYTCRYYTSIKRIESCKHRNGNGGL